MLTTEAQRNPRFVLAKSAPITLGAIDSSPGTARVSARAWLATWSLAHMADVLEIIVSELVTNAVRASERSGAPVGFRLVLTSSSVVVEVFDHAPGEPEPKTADTASEAGRGLHMVSALSRTWGWTYIDNGKVVWSEVQIERQRPA
jgi:anti-sigma regulatory factor (Ser/Thr protein kinase)